MSGQGDLKDLKYSTRTIKHFDIIEEINCKINENYQKIEVLKLCRDGIDNTNEINNINEENSRLGLLFAKLKGIIN